MLSVRVKVRGRVWLKLVFKMSLNNVSLFIHCVVWKLTEYNLVYVSVFDSGLVFSSPAVSSQLVGPIAHLGPVYSTKRWHVVPG